MSRPQRLARALSIATLLAAGTAGVAHGQTTQPTLTIGSPAPPLKVAKWFKNEPVNSLEKGQVYVVEFWATWCGPCKKSMPHVTELAKQYAGKATVMGISIWERPEDETEASLNASIQATVDQMGEKMDYHVGADGLDKTMATTWMAAAGREFIPCAFLVDRDGTIAWIGLPAEMGEPLAKVVAGTWDRDAERQRAAALAAADAEKDKLIAPIRAARKAKDPAAVLAAFDVALAAEPNFINHPDLVSIRLDALLDTDPAKAVAYVDELVKPGGIVATKPDWAWAVIRVLPTDAVAAGTRARLSPAQLARVATELRASVDAVKPFPSVLAGYASLLNAAGDPTSAVAYQQKAIDLAEKTPTKSPDEDKWIATMREQLTKFSAAAG